MTQEEKAIVDQVTEAIKGQLITKEDVQSMIDSANVSEQIKADLQGQLDNLGKAVKALGEKGEKTEKSFSQIVEEQIKTVAESVEKNGKGIMTIPTKSLVEKSTILPASITSDTAGLYLQDIGQLATKKTKMAGLFAQFPVGADSHGIIYYMDQSTATRNAAARTVGNAAAESALAWTMYSQPLQSVSDSIPFAKEMLSRYSAMEAEIRNFITTNLMLELDEQLAVGDGSAPDLKGVYTYASAFNSGAYSGFKPKSAALLDLIEVMATEVEKNTKYDVNVCIINPADALQLKLEKSSEGVRLNQFMVDAEGNMSLGKIKIVTSANIAVNTLVMGDFTKARRYFGENITLEFGYNTSGDFTKRIVTLLGNLEELLLIRNCEVDAFLKSTDIATDIANITEVVA